MNLGGDCWALAASPQPGLGAVAASSPSTVHEVAHKCQPELPSADGDVFIVCIDPYTGNRTVGSSQSWVI